LQVFRALEVREKIVELEVENVFSGRFLGFFDGLDQIVRVKRFQQIIDGRKSESPNREILETRDENYLEVERF